MVDGGAHWTKWHRDYDDSSTPLSRRLVVVQDRIRAAVDEAPRGPIRVISMCAGTGRDLLGALHDHPRRADVTARLVELDPTLAAEARATVERLGLSQVEVVEGDAAATSAYTGAVPADLLLLCGVFGNISEVDVRTTIDELPHFAAHDAIVIWTRHPRPPDRTPTIRRWFVDAEFEEVGFDVGAGGTFAVGTNRFRGEPQVARPGRSLFTFVDGEP